MGQHYVPQFYLKNFATEKGTEFYIETFFKEERKKHRVNTKKVAQEIGFYDFPGENFSAEQPLSDIEGTFSNALRNILNKPKIKELSDDDKSTIAFFMALQMNRTPVFRDMINQIAEKYHSLTKNSGEDKPDVKKSHLALMFEHSFQCQHYLEQLDWRLFESPEGSSFWTSDNPVWRHNELEPGFYGNLALNSPGVQIIFPLSPKYLLVVLDASMYKPITPYTKVSPENVMFYNSGQLIYSKRMVFSESPHFEMAQNFLTEFPQFADKERERLEIT